MPEPASTTATASLTAALILLLGPSFGPTLAPLFGEFLLVLAGALVGVMHPASKQGFASRALAAWYVIRWVLTAMMLTGAVSTVLEKYLGLPAHNWPGVVAWTITFFADKWKPWLDVIGDAWAARAGKRGGNDGTA